jgi:hypothetical protein
LLQVHQVQVVMVAAEKAVKITVNKVTVLQTQVAAEAVQVPTLVIQQVLVVQES